MLRTATEWCVADSTRCQEWQTREAALWSSAASRNWSTVSSTLSRTWSVGGDASGDGWVSSSICGRFGYGWSVSYIPTSLRATRSIQSHRCSMSGKEGVVLFLHGSHVQGRRVLLSLTHGSHMHTERRVRMADKQVPHGKLNSFITMGKMVFSPST
jgi:hypothetical protein